MEKTHLIISLSADDIPSVDFTTFVVSQHPPVQTSLRSEGKEGRDAMGYFTDLIFSNDMAVGLLGAILYDIIKFGFKQLGQLFGAQPKATITLKSGKTVILSEKMSDEAIQAELVNYVKEGVTSIHFDS